jgi:flagellar biogenesis protein FliO
MKLSFPKFLFIIFFFSFFYLNFSYSEKKLTPTPKVEVQDWTYREEKPINYNPTVTFLQAILYLILIIILIYIVIFALKFFLSKRSSIGNLISPYFIKILESAYLAPHASIHIIEIGRRIFVIGVSERTISLITEITDEETISKILESKSSQISFQKHFRSFISKFSQKKETQEINSYFEEGREYLQEKIKNLKDFQRE